MAGIKIKEEILIRNTNGAYKEFIESATKSFMNNFCYDIECRISTTQKKKTWYINEKRLPKIKNIFIKTLQDEILKEDLRTVTVETSKAINVLKKIIEDAKKDIEYIGELATKKADEELKYG